MKSKLYLIYLYINLLYFRDENKNKKMNKSKSINLLKNIKIIYESYIPKIIRSNHGFRYNLSEENIFGNLNYSMNKNLLKGKTVEIDSFSKKKDIFLSKGLIDNKSLKLIPILRYKST